MVPKLRAGLRGCLVCILLFLGAEAQSWDLPAQAVEGVSSATEGKLKISFEQRVRYESRTGTNFGKDPGIDTGLVRTRVALTYTPVDWLMFSGMMQDARAPWYGPNAPNTIRDPADLQEAYFELFHSSKTGFGMTAGRKMLSYGEGRLIGVPDWSPLARTYDHVRVYERFKAARLEFLVVSPVKIQTGSFNNPVLGDRVWGTYDSFPNVFRKNLLEVYFLRHEQNAPGGFTGGSKSAGTNRLGTNTYGFRANGPLFLGAKYDLEGAVQNGKLGPASLGAGAWYSGVSRQWMIAGRALAVEAEYKYASGTGNPADRTQSGTFDQLYAANHDKFGHEDLFGWRNLHNLRSLTSYSLTKNLTLNFMYDSDWLASIRDGLYASSGKVIAVSAKGTAGRHIGEETDIFATYRYNHFLFGAGYGHFFAGEFVRNTTPGVGPTYLYIFHTYTL